MTVEFKDDAIASKTADVIQTSSPITKKPQPSPTLLVVPPNHQLRRPSIESAFSGSDISELSFGSTELDGVHHEGLLRTLSNASERVVGIPPPSKWRARLRDFWIANYGAFLVLVSQFFGSMMNIATRLLETPGPHGAPMHPFQILLVRQSITVVLTYAYVLSTKSVPHFPLGPPGAIRWLLVARGIGGFFGVCGMYFSLQYLPISEATVLTFLVPVGACYAFSIFIAGETFSRQQQLASFISLIGVVFIARPVSLFSQGGTPPAASPDMDVTLPINATAPTHDETTIQPTPAQHLQAVALSLMGVCGAILALSAIRAIGTRAHALLSVNYFAVWCVIASSFALAVIPGVDFRLPANSIEWGWLLTLGACGFIMQFLLTQGMAYGGPSEPNKSRAQLDVEMQDRGETPPRRESGSGSGQVQPTKSKQIKGSGAKATSMLYTQMLFALISDKMIFGITPGVWSWIGSGFILTGAVWVAADGSKKTGTAAVGNAVEVAPARGMMITSKHGDLAHEEQMGLLAGADTNADVDLNGEGAGLDHIDQSGSSSVSTSSRSR